MKDVHEVSCPNQECEKVGFKNSGNIVCFGHEKSGEQRYKCKTCGHVFVESVNTIFYHHHMPHDQIIEVFRLLSALKSFREIADILHVHHDTVDNLIEKVIADVPALNQLLVEEIKMPPLEIERLWLTILKHKHKISAKTEKAIKQIIGYEDVLRREGDNIKS